MSEDDFSGKKEEMKKSIFMKRKSNDNLSPSPKSLDDSKKKSADPNKKKSPGSASPRASEERKSPERKIPNPFSFTHAKKATNDIIQNEILKNEILKRKTEEMNLKKGSSLLVNYSQFKLPSHDVVSISGQALQQICLLQLNIGEQLGLQL